MNINQNLMISILCIFLSSRGYASEYQYSDVNHVLSQIIHSDINPKKFVSFINLRYGTINLQLKGGLYILDMLVIHNQTELVQEFLHAGVNTTLRNARGKTAYDYVTTPEMKKIFLQEAVKFYNY